MASVLGCLPLSHLPDKGVYGAFCGMMHIPEDILRDLARLLLPQIIQMYESEEGKKQLEEWKAEQEKQKNAAISKSKSEG